MGGGPMGGRCPFDIRDRRLGLGRLSGLFRNLGRMVMVAALTQSDLGAQHVTVGITLILVESSTYCTLMESRFKVPCWVEDSHKSSSSYR